MARHTMKVTHVTQMTRALRRAADLAGGWTGLAQVLSQDGNRISKQAIHSWLYRGVPAERAVEIERVLKGAILREDLRPDLYDGMVRR